MFISIEKPLAKIILPNLYALLEFQVSPYYELLSFSWYQYFTGTGKMSEIDLLAKEIVKGYPLFTCLKASLSLDNLLEY